MSGSDLPLLSVSGLQKSFGQRRLLLDVSFTVAAGSVVGLLGLNGAGKTTTIRILAGLSRANGGDVRTRGTAFKVRSGQVAFLFDQPAFYPWLSGRRNLELRARALGRKRSEIDALLDDVGLTEACHRKTKTYSHGMRQRLGLAATLLGNPELVILDEPTDGLDPEGVQIFRGLVRQVRDRGGAVVMSTHVFSEVEQLCDAVVILHEGRTRQSGTLAQLRRSRGLARVAVSGLTEVEGNQVCRQFAATVVTEGPTTFEVVEDQCSPLLEYVLGLGAVVESVSRDESAEDAFFAALERSSE